MKKMLHPIQSLIQEMFPKDANWVDLIVKNFSRYSTISFSNSSTRQLKSAVRMVHECLLLDIAEGEDIIR